jgi:hypothetical protein
MDATQLLSRRPVLALLVAGEIAVVGALAAVAWHVWQQNQDPTGGGAGVSVRAPAPARASQPQTGPSVTIPVPPQPSPAPTPGIRTDPAFLEQVTLDINREETALEQLEWRIVHGAGLAGRSYIERVVLPAISRAQRAQ